MSLLHGHLSVVMPGTSTSVEGGVWIRREDPRGRRERGARGFWSLARNRARDSGGGGNARVE